MNLKAKPAWSDEFEALGSQKNQSRHSLQPKAFGKLPNSSIMVDNYNEQRRHKSQQLSARGHTDDEDRKLKTLLPRRTSPAKQNGMACVSPRPTVPDKDSGSANLRQETSGDSVQDLAVDGSQRMTMLSEDQPISTPQQPRCSSRRRPRRSNAFSKNQPEKSEKPKLSEEVQKPIPSPPQLGSFNATQPRKLSNNSHARYSLRCARLKLRQAMPEKETLEMLMKHRHQRLVKEARASNGFVLIKNRLGKEDRERIKHTFSCYDVDNSGSLDTTELQGALADLGYCPRSREEKMQFSEILKEVDRDGNGELDIHQFEQAVVRVMDMLRNLQSMELFESFHLHDVDGTGSLSLDEVFDILPELGLAPRIDEEHEMIRQCVAKVDVDNSKEIDFIEFEELLVQVRKRLHRMRRERRRSIIQQSELERKLVEAFKNEICELKDQFDCYDRDHSGCLDHSELDLLIEDCGLGPRSKAEREEIQALIAFSDKDHNGRVTFVEFLHLIHGIRQLSSERCQKELQKLFKRFDKDRSGSMSFKECSGLLEHVGLGPKTQSEQRHIGVLLEAMDEDGDGELDFQEFTHFCQRVKEMLQLKVHYKEREAAKSLQITIAQLHEYKLVFEHLDADETGQLSVKRVREMVDSLHIKMSGDELHEIFTQVDENGSGFIEFTEFLKLVSLVYKHAARSSMRFST
jgi:Ca2+-binding EF-hand superfamily protein